MSGGLTVDPGLSVPTGLSPTTGVTIGTGLSVTGISPSVGNGILLEGSVTEYLMLENGTDYLLQEA